MKPLLDSHQLIATDSTRMIFWKGTLHLLPTVNVHLDPQQNTDGLTVL